MRKEKRFAIGAGFLTVIVSTGAATMTLSRRTQSKNLQEAQLIKAVAYSDGVALQRLLHQGVSPNAYSQHNLIPYRWQRWTGRWQVMGNETPALSLAAGRGDLPTVEALLQAGAMVDIRDEIGSTPLLWACGTGRQGEPQQQIVQTLLAHGADIHAQNERGTTALMQSAETGNTTIMQSLLYAGADKELNRKDKWGMSALSLAKLLN